MKPFYLLLILAFKLIACNSDLKKTLSNPTKRLQISENQIAKVDCYCEGEMYSLDSISALEIVELINESNPVGMYKAITTHDLTFYLKNGDTISLRIFGNKFKWSETGDHAYKMNVNGAYFETLCARLKNKKPKEIFTTESIHNFMDTLSIYFEENAGYDMEDYFVKIDTVQSNDTTTLNFSLHVKTYRTNGLISFQIKTFPTSEEATDYFNELKTRELIQHFGLNKSANHIFVNENKVFWFFMRHGYGHRVKDITNIFYESFQFRPNATNLDSVSGFTYCRCILDDANLKELIGKWKVKNSFEVYEIPSEIINTSNVPNVDFTIRFTKDSIQLDNKWYKHEVRSSIELPDLKTYWRITQETDKIPYELRTLLRESGLVSDEGIKETNEYKNFVSSSSKKKIGLTLYSIFMQRGFHLKIVKPKNWAPIIIEGNRVYQLKKN